MRMDWSITKRSVEMMPLLVSTERWEGVRRGAQETNPTLWKPSEDPAPSLYWFFLTPVGLQSSMALGHSMSSASVLPFIEWSENIGVKTNDQVRGSPSKAWFHGTSLGQEIPGLLTKTTHKKSG